MAAEVWAWCEKAGTYGRTVTVKVKFADFHQVTRSRSFATVIARHDLLRQASLELVRTLLPTAKGIRLLGVTVSNFDQSPSPMSCCCLASPRRSRPIRTPLRASQRQVSTDGAARG